MPLLLQEEAQCGRGLHTNIGDLSYSFVLKHSADIAVGAELGTERASQPAPHNQIERIVASSRVPLKWTWVGTV